MAARRGNHGFSLVSQRLRASRRAVCGVCRFHWVYGISGLLALSAALCVHAILAFRSQNKASRRITAAAAPLLTVALLGAGGGLASNIRWTTPAHPPLT